MRKKLRIGIPVLMSTMLLMTACSFQSKETTNEMDTPPVSYVDENESLELDEEKPDEKEAEEIEKEQVVDFIKRELYLLDANGLVVPHTLQLPRTEGVLKQSLEYDCFNTPSVLGS